MASSNQFGAVVLTNENLPPAFRAADDSSVSAKTRFLRAVRLRLMGLVSAGAFGLATWKYCALGTDWAGVIAASCFVGSLFIEIYLLKARPERTWYQGRAAAESLKTLSWRYSVGGEPFDIGRVNERDSELLFLHEVDDVIAELRQLDLSVRTSLGTQISDAMRQLRSASLDERKAIYDRGRVQDQQEWYKRNASWNSRRAFQWTAAMLLLEIAGTIAAILKATGLIEGDLLIFTGAVVASIAAWVQTKQHETLANAYAITAIELASVRTKIGLQTTEPQWAKFVSEAEHAFSKEHTLWKASRGIRSI